MITTVVTGVVCFTGGYYLARVLLPYRFPLRPSFSGQIDQPIPHYDYRELIDKLLANLTGKHYYPLSQLVLTSGSVEEALGYALQVMTRTYTNVIVTQQCITDEESYYNLGDKVSNWQSENGKHCVIMSCQSRGLQKDMVLLKFKPNSGVDNE